MRADSHCLLDAISCKHIHTQNFHKQIIWKFICLFLYFNNSVFPCPNARAERDHLLASCTSRCWLIVFSEELLEQTRGVRFRNSKGLKLNKFRGWEISCCIYMLCWLLLCMSVASLLLFCVHFSQLNDIFSIENNRKFIQVSEKQRSRSVKNYSNSIRPLRM